MSANEKQPLVQVKNLCKYFQINRHATLKAVDNMTFDIYKGETVSLVGESGCGKSTTGRCMIKLYQPTKGEVFYDGKDIFKLSHAEKRDFCNKVQMIFQNPYSSLNPRMTVKEIVGEGLKQQGIPQKEIDERVEKLLKMVGLNKDHMSRFPHEFSGGQRQRIGIARALSMEPEFIICDEPISALDVSIQAQVVNMLMKFQRELGLTYLFIAHDLSMVRHIADETAVMYLGTMVEYGPTEEVYGHPAHPYTQGLLSAVPVADPDYEKTHHRIPMEGEVPSPIDPKPGCRFCGRCPRATEQCRTQTPAPKDLSGGHFAACHHLD